MEYKTQIISEADQQELFIVREFDAHVELLFRAYTEAELLEQWMSTKVIKLESKKHGSYLFETSDANGKIILQSSGVIHDLVLNQKITRTFEMENTPFPVQLEFLVFEKISEQSCKLTMQVVYKSVGDRDAILKLPFAFGINMAHNKLQEVINKLK
jgi:uncharacterized protein YndB with AHSA1/START domain